MPFSSEFKLSSASLLLLALLNTASAQVDYSQYVNPFIGGQGPIEGLACKLATYHTQVKASKNPD